MARGWAVWRLFLGVAITKSRKTNDSKANKQYPNQNKFNSERTTHEPQRRETPVCLYSVIPKLDYEYLSYRPNRNAPPVSNKKFRLTLLDAKNSMARATCSAQMYRSIVVNVTSACSVGVVQVASKMSRRLRRKSSKLPWGQYSIITQRSRSIPYGEN